MQEEDSRVYRRWMCSVNWVKAWPVSSKGSYRMSSKFSLSYGDVLLHIAAHGFLMVLSYRICTVLCMRSLSGYCTCCLRCCVTTGGKIFSPHNTRKGKCTLFSAENVKVWLWCSMQSSSQLSSETHSFISTHTLYTLRINEKFEVSPIFFQIISNFVFMRELFCWRWTSETLQGLCQSDKE